MRAKYYFLGRQMGKTCLQVAEEAERLRLIEEPLTVVVDEFPQKTQLEKVAEVLKKLKRSNTEEDFHISIKNQKKSKRNWIKSITWIVILSISMIWAFKLTHFIATF